MLGCSAARVASRGAILGLGSFGDAFGGACALTLVLCLVSVGARTCLSGPIAENMYDFLVATRC